MRCFGYSRTGEIVDAEAAVIRDAATRLLRGDTLHDIIRDLRTRNVETTAGNSFQPATLRRLLVNPRLIGKRMHNGNLAAVGDWQPILDQRTHDQLVSLLNDPARRTNPNPGRQRKYLLSGGLIRCGLCGEPLRAQPSNHGKRGYVCRTNSGGCGRIRIAAEGVENDVAERVLARLASQSVRRRLVAVTDAPSIDEQLEQLEARLREAGEHFADAKIGGTEFRAASKRIRERQRELRAQARQAEQVGTLPDVGSPTALAEWWHGSSIDRRRSLVATLLDHVTVGPVTRRGFTGYDPERVSFVWE